MIKRPCPACGAQWESGEWNASGLESYLECGSYGYLEPLDMREFRQHFDCEERCVEQGVKIEIVSLKKQVRELKQQIKQLTKANQ